VKILKDDLNERLFNSAVISIPFVISTEGRNPLHCAGIQGISQS